MNKDYPILVSVCSIAYNHEKYIAQMIESVIIQKTCFDYVLIIGEDCSTDKTREICDSYKSRYPDKIKLLYNDKNIGASKNIINVLNYCQSKYIAICEGDDYWTDPYKLQKQVDFLEVNPEYSAAVHQTERINENNPNKKELYFKYSKDVLSKKEVIRSTSIHTNSIVFRKDALMKYDLKDAKHLVEHALFILIVQSGKFKVFPEVMSVYRMHNCGIAATSTPEKAYVEQLAWIGEIKKILGWKFYWGYHFLTSKVHCYYLLNHPETFTRGLFAKLIIFMKYAFMVLIYFPRNTKTVMRLLPKFGRLLIKE